MEQGQCLLKSTLHSVFFLGGGLSSAREPVCKGTGSMLLSEEEGASHPGRSFSFFRYPFL